MRDERRYPRAQPTFRCWLEGKDFTLYTLVGDLSEGGLQLKMGAPLEPGCKAKVRISLEDAAELCASACVVWTHRGGAGDPPGMGLRFEGLAVEDRRRIKRAVRNHLPSGG